MGIGVARIGDRVKGNCGCSGHDSDPYDGIIISGSETTFANGLGVAYISSVVKSSCGHKSIIISGSETVFTNGLGTAYITSEFSGDCYVGSVIAGAENVFSG